MQRSSQASPYWWIPGTKGSRQTFSHISCGDPNRPRHGSSLFGSVQAGAIVVHSCNPGYKLVGAKLRLCQSNGQWTPELPQCVCKSQSRPLGQKLILSGLAYKEVIRSSLLYTTVDYSLHTSHCYRKTAVIDCGDPGTPIYGSRWSGSTSLHSIVTYMCNPGFNLVGNSFRVCQSSGRWSGALPICQRKIGMLLLK